MQKNNFANCFDCAYISETGLVRNNNEDAAAVLAEEGCFAVADGMGGHEGGEIASGIVVKNISDLLTDAAVVSPGERKFAINKALSQANGQINNCRIVNGFSAIGSTLALLLFDPWNFSIASVCHCGDSRVYCLRNGELFQLTQDHNMAEVLKRSNPGNSKSTAVAGNLLTRAVGIAPNIYPEWADTAVCLNDIFIVCSDGLSSVLADEEIIEAVSVDKTAARNVDELKSRISAAGAPDNFTVICVKILQIPPKADISGEDMQESNYLLNIANRIC